MALGKACRDWLTASRPAAGRARVTASRAVLRGEPADTAGVSAAQRHSAAPAPRQGNPRFHDMIVGACDAGFEPLPGPPVHHPVRHPRRDRHRTARLDRVLTPPRRPEARTPAGVPATCRADTDSTNLPRGAPAVRPSPAAPAQRLRIGPTQSKPSASMAVADTEVMFTSITWFTDLEAVRDFAGTITSGPPSRTPPGPCLAGGTSGSLTTKRPSGCGSRQIASRAGRAKGR